MFPITYYFCFTYSEDVDEAESNTTEEKYGLLRSDMQRPEVDI